MRDTSPKDGVIEYWFIIYTNVPVVPYYIVPWFFCGKLLENLPTTEATRYKIDKRLRDPLYYNCSEIRKSRQNILVGDLNNFSMYRHFR